MTDYSSYDENTLRNMLDASCDLDERQQLRSILRRLKKHSNTVCFSPNTENIVNSKRNHLHMISSVAPLERFSYSSPSPFAKHELQENYPSPGRGSNKASSDELGSAQNGTHDSNALRVINGWNRNPRINGYDVNSSTLIKEDARNPVGILKQNLGSTLSEPIIAKDDSRLAQSRLIIQKMLAPRVTIAATTDNAERSRTIHSRTEDKRRSEIPATTVRTIVVSNEPSFTRPLCDLSVAEGETAVLECSVKARHQPMILWYRDFKPLALINGKHVHTYDGDLVQLTIRNVESSDVGIYECVARNSYGKSSSSGRLVVKDAGHLATRQTRQLSRVGGVSMTNFPTNKYSAALRATQSFNDADFASKQNSSKEAGFNPVQRSATTVKQRLLRWCQVTLKDYQHINITNFSSSWSDGMAFCAVVHHFIPDAFDYNKLNPKNRSENFQLAFETAEKRAGIMQLLDVEDMVKMAVPDWKCVFMYVLSIYRAFVLPKQDSNLTNPINAHR